MITETNTETTTNTEAPRRKGKKPTYAPGAIVKALIPQRRALEFTGVVRDHGKFRLNDAGEAVADENISESFYVIEVQDAPEDKYDGRTFLLNNNKILGTVEDLRARDEARRAVTENIENRLSEGGITFRPDNRQKNPAWILNGTFTADSLRDLADILDSEGFEGVQAKVQIHHDSTVAVTRPEVNVDDVFSGGTSADDDDFEDESDIG